MGKDNSVFYGCPYCNQIVKGPHNNPAFGKSNLQTHVKSKHEAKLEEFLKTNMDDYEVEEEPVEEGEVIAQTEEQKHPIQKIEIPIEEVQDPEIWLEGFLKSQASIKDKFVVFQKQRVKLDGSLPQPMDLEMDLKRMDSGVKNETEAFYIRRFYEQALEKYLDKLEVDRNYGRGIRTEKSQPPYEYHRGVQVRREFYDRDPYPPEPRSVYRGGTPQSWMEEELMRLREESRRRDEEDRARREREFQELRSQNQSLQQQLQTGGGGGGNSRLEQEIKEMQTENKRMAEQYNQLREQTLMERIRQAELKADSVMRASPSAEDIKGWLQDTVQGYRNQLMVEKNLEDLIDKKLSLHTGPSMVEVEMEKARNELLLGTKKLEMDEKKAANWGETFKNVAGAFGQGIGQAAAGKQQQQQQQQEQPEQVPCPHCNMPLMLPPNARYGICPNCNGKIEVDEQGTPHRFIEPEPQQPASSGTTTYVPQQNIVTQSPQTTTPPPQTTTGDVDPTPPAQGAVTAQQRYRKKKQSEQSEIPA